MKAIAYLVAASLLASSTGFAQNQALDQLFDDSQGSVQQERQIEADKVRAAHREVVSLKTKVTDLERDLSRSRLTRNVTLTVTVATAAAAGWLLNSAIRGNYDITGMGIRLIGSVVPGAIAITSGFVAGREIMEIKIDSDQLAKLNKSLEAAEKKFEAALKELTNK